MRSLVAPLAFSIACFIPLLSQTVPTPPVDGAVPRLASPQLPAESPKFEEVITNGRISLKVEVNLLQPEALLNTFKSYQPRAEGLAVEAPFLVVLKQGSQGDELYYAGPARPDKFYPMYSIGFHLHLNLKAVTEAERNRIRPVLVSKDGVKINDAPWADITVFGTYEGRSYGVPEKYQWSELHVHLSTLDGTDLGFPDLPLCSAPVLRQRPECQSSQKEAGLALRPLRYDGLYCADATATMGYRCLRFYDDGLVLFAAGEDLGAEKYARVLRRSYLAGIFSGPCEVHGNQITFKVSRQNPSEYMDLKPSMGKHSKISSQNPSEYIEFKGSVGKHSLELSSRYSIINDHTTDTYDFVPVEDMEP